MLKTFHRHGTVQQYEKEVKAFAILRQKVPKRDGIVTFFGSFVQNESFHILLEYADGGTLQDYFQKVIRPSSIEDKHNFWKSFLPLAKALKAIHQVDSDDPEHRTVLHG